MLEESPTSRFGDKHDKTTHVVKTWIYKLNVSYASTYIFRSDRWGKKYKQI